jgi:hypothetical protein
VPEALLVVLPCLRQRIALLVMLLLLLLLLLLKLVLVESGGLLL